MKLSVIIPALNEERVLPTTLRHTLPLGFDEILVVDGGSSDRTCEEVEKFQVSSFEFQPDNPKHQTQNSKLKLLTAAAGRARQMNAGAAAAIGDVLVFLHADTLLPLDARDALVQGLADPGTVGGRFDLRFERDRGLAWLIGRLITLRSRLSGIATGDQAIFVRRAAFDALGGYAEIPIMEDVEFTTRLTRRGRTAALRARVTTSYRRWERRGPIRTILLMWSLRFLYWIGISPSRLKALYSDER